jgi:hypothetical protein
MSAALEHIAQIEGLAAQLTQFGALGVVLAWFMFRTEGRLRNIEVSCDRLANAILLQVVSDPYVHDETKKRAKSLMAEIDKKMPNQ